MFPWIHAAGLSIAALATGHALTIEAYQGDPPRPQAPGASGAREEAFDPRPFRIRDTQAARWQHDEIEAHVAARRWSEAIDGLQAVIEEHAGDVLGPEQVRLANGQRASHATHHGAAPRARARLFALPPEAQRLYRERHEPEARAALLHGAQGFDRAALWEVARRYPLTRSAQRAAWTLGDLEWERGHASEALAGWARALELATGRLELDLANPAAWEQALERLQGSARIPDEPAAPPAANGDEPQAGDARDRAAAGRRVALAREWLAKRDREALQRSGQRGSRGVRPPGREADGWFEPFVVPPHPFQRTPRLLPARSDTSLFVSTSLRLFALDAYTGGLLWKCDEVPGWAGITEKRRNDFFAGIDSLSVLVQPAVTDRVAVTALQIPVTFIEAQDFQGSIGITKIIPDRRLFAFDARTGTPLWDHRPPADWDGDSGGFLTRMSIAGPPVIAERRVIAPCYRMQGRIDYHVGCFDLDTGALLWSTDVISGQRELNMFGRPEKEFCAPPVVVEGDRIYAQTQLGAVACLDLYTGEVRWVTLYDQIPLPRTRELAAPHRSAPWRNQPPAVAGSVLVAAPFDSFHLLGIDTDRGTLLWSMSNQTNSTIETLAGVAAGRIDQLVGARGDTVYLAGERVLALRSPSGLSSGPPLAKHWVFDHPALDRGRPAGTCVLADDRLVVPADELCLSVDLVSGRAADEGLAWSPGAEDGNLLVCERELFVASNRRVMGYFEWGILVQRARRLAEDHPGDARAALALGRLLANRGALELERRGRSQEAREALGEARAVLERVLAQGAEAGRTELETELHRTLRALARAHASLADTKSALAALRRARALAPSTAELRDTLLEELALGRTRSLTERGDERSELDAREALLEELARSCGALSILCDPAPPVGPAERPEGGDGAFEALPFAFDPIVGGSARADLVPLEMPVALWTLLASEREAIRQKDVAREFVLLHRILAEHGDNLLLGETAGELAAARIGELLRNGLTTGYEVFAARAEAELAAAEGARDRERLVAITRRYPFSPAARKANDARLEWALEAGAIAEVAAILQGELPSSWRADRASERERELVLHLASAARRAGNAELEHELLRELVLAAPEHRSNVPDYAGRSLAELAAGRFGPDAERAAAQRSPTRSETPGRSAAGRFALDAKPIPESTLVGEYELLGRTMSPIPPISPAPATAEDTGSAEADLLVGFTVGSPNGRRRAATLYAIASTGSVRWFVQLPSASGPIDSLLGPFDRHVACSPGRVLVACADSMFAVDSASGEVAWTWSLPESTPSWISLTVESGVALLAVRDQEHDDLAYHALDAWSGGLLWQDGPIPREFARDPLVAGNRVVALPATTKTGVQVRDLFTGRTCASFQVDCPADARIAEQAWVEGGRLIVPRFGQQSLTDCGQVAAYDLQSGRRSWRIALSEVAGEPKQLEQILQARGRTYFVLQTRGGTKAQSFQTGLFELSPAIGALAPIHTVRLSAQDHIAGARSDSRTVFADSTVLVMSASQSGEARVRAIDLERGELWAQSLGTKFDSIHPKNPPAPVWSETGTVLCYGVRTTGRTASANIYLAFFERAGGVLRETRLLDARAMEKTDQVVLAPLGDLLVLRGKHRVEFLR